MKTGFYDKNRVEIIIGDICIDVTGHLYLIEFKDSTIKASYGTQFNEYYPMNNFGDKRTSLIIVGNLQQNENMAKNAKLI